MGWTDDEIDGFFREASNHQKVSYNDAYWKEMEAMLNTEKPVKRRFFWWFFGVTAVVLMVGTGYYFMTVQQHSVQVSGSQEQQSGEALSSDRSELSEGALEYGEEKVTGADETQQVLSDRAEIDREKLSLRSNNTRVNSDRQVAASDGTTAFVLENGQVEGYEHSENTTEKEGFDVNPLKLDREWGGLHLSDEENRSLKTFPTADPAASGRFGFYVGVDAGAGTSYIKSSKDLLVQWGAKMGVDYTFGNRIRVGGGVGFRQQIIKNLNLERNREYYSFGLISVNQSISYDRLQFIDLNLHAHYSFRKINLGVEVTPSYLISARAKMEQTQVVSGKIEYESPVSEMDVEQQFVRTDNLNPFGIDAGLSFQYEFKYKMILELGVNARLNNMLRSKHFVGEYNKLPVRLELGIIKRF